MQRSHCAARSSAQVGNSPQTVTPRARTAVPSGLFPRSRFLEQVVQLGAHHAAHSFAPSLAHKALAQPPRSTMSVEATAHVTHMPPLCTDLKAWQALAEHMPEANKTHLRDLLADEARCKALMLSSQGILLDVCRQRVTPKTLSLLLELAKEAHVPAKIAAMYGGDHINNTEDRAVLHVATRARRDQSFYVDGKDVVPDVWAVLDRIKAFSDKVRSGQWKGVTGKEIKNVVAIGIGGSYLGPLFVHTALQNEPRASKAAAGRQLRFIANVDPVDTAIALDGLDPATTMVVVVSKTFTTAETMLNARLARDWLIKALGPDCVSKHMVAVSTNLKLVKDFGIDTENAFGFWDWVGGRYSVCSAVGVLPLALQYGFDVAQEFLEGANAMDEHFKTEPLETNMPVLLGLIGLWNSSFLGFGSRAILPYSQALAKFSAHIQQVDMESNGKGVDKFGRPLPMDAGEVVFGEPGTNGQHSFYQLIHQGRVTPAEFIGMALSQVQDVPSDPKTINSHDELMCNFFAQADALAYGKTAEELVAEGVAPELVPHKTFKGNRPSLSILLPEINAFTVGQLLALYEHRVAVQGFIWGVNSFDQWGVELGKVLALKVRGVLGEARASAMANQPITATSKFNYSTQRLMAAYIETQKAKTSSN